MYLPTYVCISLCGYEQIRYTKKIKCHDDAAILTLIKVYKGFKNTCMSFEYGDDTGVEEHILWL